MSFSLPRAAGAVALACAASALTLPLASPAHAVTPPVEKLFVTADVNHDVEQKAGLFTRATDSGALTAVVPESATVDVHSLSRSGDGSRVIYVQDNFDAATGEPVSSQVVVRDIGIGTRLVRVLETRVWDDVHFLSTPVLSPDGNNAVWEEYDFDADQVTARKAAVSTGKATTLKAGLSPYGFLDATTVLAQDIDGAPSTITLSGTVGSVTGLPVEAINVAISPTGTPLRLAFGLFDTTVTAPNPLKAAMKVATATLTNGTLTIDTANVKTLTTDGYNEEPTFSADGTKVYWIHGGGTFGSATDVWTAPADASSAAGAAGTTTAANETDVADAITDDGTAPGATTAKPAVLKGTSATLSWTRPGDADLSGTLVKRTLGTQTRTYFWASPLSSFTDVGLTLGKTYSYAFYAIDRSGHYGTAATLTLTAIQAKATFADPTSRTSTKASFPVVLGPVAPAGTLFTVDYTATGSAAWVRWLTNASGATHTFPGVAGKSYSFKVQATDGHGNATPAVVSGRAVVPFDQTKAAFTGGGNGYRTGTYLGSYRKLWHRGDLARVTLTGNRLQIIGTTCGTCGTFDLFDNGTWVTGVGTYASSTRLRQVLFTKTYSSIGTHSFTIRPRATSGHPDVILDGFATRT